MKALSLIPAILLVAGVASADHHEATPTTVPAVAAPTDAAAAPAADAHAKKAEKKKHSKKAKKGEGETH